jgi:hypothetical protein
MTQRTQPQWSVAGIVEAPVEQVWDSLLDAQGLMQMVRQSHEKVIVTDDAYAGRTEIDQEAHTITRQGHWWYRGVHTVEAHMRGSVIRYEVFNIAPGMGWWAAQLVQGPQHTREMKHIMEEALHSIGQRLGCRTALK